MSRETRPASALQQIKGESMFQLGQKLGDIQHYGQKTYLQDRGCPPAMVLRHSSLSTVVEFYGKEDHWDGIGGLHTRYAVAFSSALAKRGKGCQGSDLVQAVWS
eukprot:scaffold148520_cov43-Cyclotella_meneghiniana.AAC.1